MATKTKQSKYPKSEAKYIRVKDDSGLQVVKEGTVYLYWSPKSDRDHAFTTPSMGFVSAKTLQDLNLVMLQGKFEISDKNDFPAYVPRLQRDVEAKAVAKAAEEELEKTREAEKTVTAPSTPPSTQKRDPNAWVKMNVPKPAPTPSAPTGAKAGKAVKSGSMVKKAQVQRPPKEKEPLLPTYEGLTDKEIQLLFSLAYQQRYGKSEGIGKAWSSKDPDEIKEFIDPFVMYDLTRRGAVPDELIPPLSILKKLDGIKDNPELLYYYEKKLGQKKDEEPAKKRVQLRDGKSFDAKKLPVSLRLAVGAGRLALKAGSSAASAIKSLVSKDKSISDKEFTKSLEDKKPSKVSKVASMVKSLVSKNETRKTLNEKIVGTSPKHTLAPVVSTSKIVDTNKDAFKLTDTKQSKQKDVPRTTDTQYSKQSVVSINGIKGFLGEVGKGVKERLTPSQQTHDEASAMGKFVGEGLKNIAKILAERLPKQKTTSVDTSVKEARNVEGVDKDIAEPVKQAAQGATKAAPEVKKEDSGIFGKIMDLFKGKLKVVGELLNGLGKAIRPLLSLFGKLGSALMSVMGRLGGAIASGAGKLATSVGTAVASRGVLAAAGSVRAVAAAGYAGYLAGTYLNEKFGLSDKIADAALKLTGGDVSPEIKAQNAQIEQTQKQKMLAAGVSKEMVEKWKITDPSLPAEYIQIKQKERAAKSQQLQSASKNKASQVQAAETQREVVADVKQQQDTKQIIDATTKNTTTVVQQQATMQRMFPRTSNSTFQKFLDSRAVFA